MRQQGAISKGAEKSTQFGDTKRKKGINGKTMD